MGLTDQTTVKEKAIGMPAQSHELLGAGTVEVRWIRHHQGRKEWHQMRASRRGHGVIHTDMVHLAHLTIPIIVLLAQVPYREGHPIRHNIACLLFQQQIRIWFHLTDPLFDPSSWSILTTVIMALGMPDLLPLSSSSSGLLEQWISKKWMTCRSWQMVVVDLVGRHWRSRCFKEAMLHTPHPISPLRPSFGDDWLGTILKA